MRIQIYSGNFFPEKTGIGKYTGEMAAWLAERGHDVHVITGFPYYPEWKLAAEYPRTRYLIERKNGVTIHRVPHYIPQDGKVTSFRRILVDLTIFAASSINWLGILVANRDKRPDVVIAVCPPLFSGIWPWLVGKLRRIPWVYHVQDFQVDAAVNLGMIKSDVLGQLLYRVENHLIRSATRVSSITAAMCRRAIAKGAAPDRIFELPNWCDLRGIYPQLQDTAFRRGLGLPKDAMLVMYAGAMGRKQGLGLVLEAASLLRNDARFHFLMIGSGSEAEQLKKDAESATLRNISFLPLQPIEKINEVLGSANIHLVIQKASAADLVMPSKLTNILAAGRPVIATAEPGTALWEVIAVSQAGIVTPPEDAAALAHALRKLAAAPELRELLSRNARHYAEKHLAKDTILGRLEREIFYLRSRNKPMPLAPISSDA